MVWPQQIKATPGPLCSFGRAIHWFAAVVAFNLALLAGLFALFPSQFFDPQIGYSFAGVFAALTILVFLVGRVLRLILSRE